MIIDSEWNNGKCTQVNKVFDVVLIKELLQKHTMEGQMRINTKKECIALLQVKASRWIIHWGFLRIKSGMDSQPLRLFQHEILLDIRHGFTLMFSLLYSQWVEF